MLSVLFIHSHTLYAKVTIPIALECIKRGWRVTFQVNRPVIFNKSYGFSEKVIMSNPTSVNVLNPGSYRYIAEIIGLSKQWHQAEKNIYYTIVETLFVKKYDLVIGTTKDMPKLWKFFNKGVPAVAIGYQHLPVIARIGHKSVDKISSDSIFFSDNLFSNVHKFSSIVNGCAVQLSGFSNLDHVYENVKLSAKLSDYKVLIFHPGGYRNVITAPNENKVDSYSAQKRFIARLCLPLVEKGIKAVIKVHPLRARYHDKEDLDILANEIMNEYRLDKNSISIIPPKGWYWDVAFSSKFILTFGSSSVYELWSSGLSNVYVCNFEGVERSIKFKIFDEIFINKYDDYIRMIKNDLFNLGQKNDLTIDAISSYGNLFDGTSVKNTINMIEAIK